MSGNGEASLNALVDDMTKLTALHLLALANLLKHDNYIRDSYRDEMSKLLKETKCERRKT